MSNSVRVECVLTSLNMLFDGIKQLGMGLKDLREARSELRELENIKGEIVQVDYIMENEHQEQIGIKWDPQGHVEFVVQKKDQNSTTVCATIDKATQAYARLKILDEVKRKGYSKIKEEKLPNGSIRLVVEKWQ